MYKNFLNLIKFTKLNHSIKNLIIIFPILASGTPLKEIELKIFIVGFVALVLLTSACYIINDLKDRITDRFNKLKKNKVLFSKKTSYIIFFIYIFFLFLLILIFNELKFFTLLFYFLNFLIYNFLGKKIKYLDIILLTNFYNLRILFGSEIFDIQPTFGFILLSFFIFFLLSVSKRIIQVNVNNLKTKNKIISYSKKDLEKLFLIFRVSCYLINLILIVYYVQYFGILYFNILSTLIFLGTDLAVYKIFLTHIIFLIYYLYLEKSLKQKKIKLDIFDFIIKNKINYITLVLFIFMFYY